jgi:nucleotide-binding universal stress UspA family protein
MAIFPTTILLATDGSKEAELAARTAADLAKSHNSELHVVYVEPALPMIGKFADHAFGGGPRQCIGKGFALLEAGGSRRQDVRYNRS